MKTRESGMPGEQMWEEFYLPEVILERLGIWGLSGDIADFGCGYGTFAIPAAKNNLGLIYALDIDAGMIRTVKHKARESGLKNIRAVQRDFMAVGSGLPDKSCEYVMLFNLLHAEEPMEILSEANRILVPGGRAGVIHWIHDSTTPRGPSLEIRPRPEQCQTWLVQAGFLLEEPVISFPPYHYGLVGKKA